MNPLTVPKAAPLKNGLADDEQANTAQFERLQHILPPVLSSLRVSPLQSQPQPHNHSPQKSRSFYHGFRKREQDFSPIMMLVFMISAFIGVGAFALAWSNHSSIMSDLDTVNRNFKQRLIVPHMSTAQLTVGRTVLSDASFVTTAPVVCSKSMLVDMKSATYNITAPFTEVAGRLLSSSMILDSGLSVATDTVVNTTMRATGDLTIQASATFFANFTSSSFITSTPTTFNGASRLAGANFTGILELMSSTRNEGELRISGQLTGMSNLTIATSQWNVDGLMSVDKDARLRLINQGITEWRTGLVIEGRNVNRILSISASSPNPSFHFAVSHSTITVNGSVVAEQPVGVNGFVSIVRWQSQGPTLNVDRLVIEGSFASNSGNWTVSQNVQLNGALNVSRNFYASNVELQGNARFESAVTAVGSANVSLSSALAALSVNDSTKVNATQISGLLFDASRSSMQISGKLESQNVSYVSSVVRAANVTASDTMLSSTLEAGHAQVTGNAVLTGKVVLSDLGVGASLFAKASRFQTGAFSANETASLKGNLSMGTGIMQRDVNISSGNLIAEQVILNSTFHSNHHISLALLNVSGTVSISKTMSLHGPTIFFSSTNVSLFGNASLTGSTLSVNCTDLVGSSLVVVKGGSMQVAENVSMAASLNMTNTGLATFTSVSLRGSTDVRENVTMAAGSTATFSGNMLANYSTAAGQIRFGSNMTTMNLTTVSLTAAGDLEVSKTLTVKTAFSDNSLMSVSARLWVSKLGTQAMSIAGAGPLLFAKTSVGRNIQVTGNLSTTTLTVKNDTETTGMTVMSELSCSGNVTFGPGYIGVIQASSLAHFAKPVEIFSPASLKLPATSTAKFTATAMLLSSSVWSGTGVITGSTLMSSNVQMSTVSFANTVNVATTITIAGDLVSAAFADIEVPTTIAGSVTVSSTLDVHSPATFQNTSSVAAGKVMQLSAATQFLAGSSLSVSSTLTIGASNSLVVSGAATIGSAVVVGASTSAVFRGPISVAGSLTASTGGTKSTIAPGSSTYAIDGQDAYFYQKVSILNEFRLLRPDNTYCSKMMFYTTSAGYTQMRFYTNNVVAVANSLVTTNVYSTSGNRNLVCIRISTNEGEKCLLARAG